MSEQETELHRIANLITETMVPGTAHEDADLVRLAASTLTSLRQRVEELEAECATANEYHAFELKSRIQTERERDSLRRELDAMREENTSLSTSMIVFGTTLQRFRGHPFDIWHCGDHYHIQGNGISEEHLFLRGCMDATSDSAATLASLKEPHNEA